VRRLSYVVPADGWDVVRELADALGRQTAAGEIELVLVTRRPFETSAPSGLPVRIVVRDDPYGASGRAAGIRAATGEVVVLGETHVVPSEGWARSVLDAHDRGARAVVPRMVNANPRTALSWAAMLMDYGRYAVGATSRLVLPTYNVAVARDALLALPHLEDALVPGPELDRVLRASGASVAHATGGVVAHLNVDRPLDWARERVLAGLLLGRARRAGFGGPRRVAYAVAAPAIAVLLFARASAAPRDGAPGGTLPALALACSLYAAGEALGYVGPAHGTRAARRMADYELHKRRYVRGRA
jgi:hypothetical protein